MSSHVAVIVGISGNERYLAQHGEVTERKRARHFRCEASAVAASREHIASFKPVVQRHVSFRVEPVESA